MTENKTGEHWSTIRTVSEMGKSRELIQCPCGALIWAFTWSWAGHGVKPCPDCGRRLLFEGGVKPPKSKGNK